MSDCKLFFLLLLFGYLIPSYHMIVVQTRKPAFAATWRHGLLAAEKAIPMLKQGAVSLDALELGTNIVERDTADQYFVGVGGYPNAKGIMELDAAIMDHDLRYGAVMSLKNIAIPISVARTVMDECPHNVLTAEGALEWALTHNFKEENILTPEIAKEYEAWKATQVELNKEDSHDTVGVICLDEQGRLSCGTSTSG
jgi:N4-(beta-N-acetylglucosaminyl)-L-asparaginase